MDQDGKARGKEIHRRVMIGMGVMTAASGLAAAYLAFGAGGELPGWMYGTLRRTEASAPLAVRRAKPSLVLWRDWAPWSFREAKGKDRLMLLNVCASWSRPCRIMDETTYADPKVARYIRDNFTAVRVDADERPDLALRYLSGGWPGTALLLPGGEILDAGTFMPPELFLKWAGVIQSSFRDKRQAVNEAVSRAAEERAKALSARPEPSSRPQARQAADSAREKLLAEWDEATEGFGTGARFPRFARISALFDLKGQNWAPELARKAARGTLALEDPVWGGFYRYAAGPGWENPHYEKRLEDQAEAIAALAQTDPVAAQRALDFVRAFMADPAGGYYANLPPEINRVGGRIVEGAYYYNQPEAKRRALGLPKPDRRLFSAANARMVCAVLESGGGERRKDRDHALKTVERFWRRGVSKGQVVRRLGGRLTGLLEDQAAWGQAFLAAYEATGESRHRDRALEVAQSLESRLLDERSQVYFDRPAAGELPEGLDRILAPQLNAEALRFCLRLAKALPSDHPFQPTLDIRREALRDWLSPRSGALDAAQWAALLY